MNANNRRGGGARMVARLAWAAALLALHGGAAVSAPPREARGDRPIEPLRIAWADEYLSITAGHLPADGIRVHYLEAFCRAGSTHRDWRGFTKIPHATRLASTSADGLQIELESTLADGVAVRHAIRADGDEIDFQLTANNPTATASEAHWAQPCIRLAQFTGRTQQDYLSKCFIFVDGRLARLPTEPWATEALYVPGQVYCPAHVDRNDVNPRPLSAITPSSGLCGVFSGDERWVLATAWEPYQELFQGVGVCMHSDFRIGGLAPGETKHIRGKIYITPAAEMDALVERYERDFPEHRRSAD